MKDTLYMWWREASLADIRKAADRGTIYTDDGYIDLPQEIREYLSAYANIMEGQLELCMLQASIFIK